MGKSFLLWWGRSPINHLIEGELLQLAIDEHRLPLYYTVLHVAYPLEGLERVFSVLVNDEAVFGVDATLA